MTDSRGTPSALLLSLLNHCFPSAPRLPPLLRNEGLLSLLHPTDPPASLESTLKAKLTSRAAVPYADALEDYKELSSLASRGALDADELDMLTLCYFTSRHALASFSPPKPFPPLRPSRGLVLPPRSVALLCLEPDTAKEFLEPCFPTSVSPSAFPVLRSLYAVLFSHLPAAGAKILPETTRGGDATEKRVREVEEMAKGEPRKFKKLKAAMSSGGTSISTSSSLVAAVSASALPSSSLPPNPTSPAIALIAGSFSPPAPPKNCPLPDLVLHLATLSRSLLPLPPHLVSLVLNSISTLSDTHHSVFCHDVLPSLPVPLPSSTLTPLRLSATTPSRALNLISGLTFTDLNLLFPPTLLPTLSHHRRNKHPLPLTVVVTALFSGCAEVDALCGCLLGATGGWAVCRRDVVSVLWLGKVDRKGVLWASLPAEVRGEVEGVAGGTVKEYSLWGGRWRRLWEMYGGGERRGFLKWLGGKGFKGVEGLIEESLAKKKKK